MKNLERNEMKNLKGGVYSDDFRHCTWLMTGSGGNPNNPTTYDYRVTCNRGNGTTMDQDMCFWSCQPGCNTIGCSFEHYWLP